MGFKVFSRAMHKLGNKVSKLFSGSSKSNSKSKRSRPNERVLQDAHALDAASATRIRYSHGPHGANPGEPHSHRGDNSPHGQSPSHNHTSRETTHPRAGQQHSFDRGHNAQNIRVAERINISAPDLYVATNKRPARPVRAEMSRDRLSRSNHLEIRALGPLDTLEAVLRDAPPRPSNLSIQTVARNDQRITRSAIQERGMRASISGA